MIVPYKSDEGKLSEHDYVSKLALDFQAYSESLCEEQASSAYLQGRNSPAIAAKQKTTFLEQNVPGYLIPRVLDAVLELSRGN